jgi:NarL family two-component system response regulator YdfI
LKRKRSIAIYIQPGILVLLDPPRGNQQPDVLNRVLDLSRTPEKTAPPQDSDLSLTDREPEVLQAAALGDRNKEIAYKLGISERTVKSHLISIYNKFGFDSRTAAVAIATQQGLLDPGYDSDA